MSGGEPTLHCVVKVQRLNPSFGGIWCRVVLPDYQQTTRSYVLILLLVEYGVGSDVAALVESNGGVS